MLQLMQIDVTLEGYLQRGIMCFITNHIHKNASVSFLMIAGGGKIHISRYILTRFDRDLRQQVLCPSALMGGYDMSEPKHLPHSLFEVAEIAAAGISFITQHHPGPLTVTHRIGAAVGQQININLFTGNKECVIAGLFYNFLSFYTRGYFHLFYRFDTERFRRIAV